MFFVTSSRRSIKRLLQQSFQTLTDKKIEKANCVCLRMFRSVLINMKVPLMLTLFLAECQGGYFFKTDLNDELVKFALNELLEMFKVRLRAKWGQEVKLIKANYAEIVGEDDYMYEFVVPGFGQPEICYVNVRKTHNETRLSLPTICTAYKKT